MDSREKTKKFLAGYFHEDWVLEYQSYVHAVRAYVMRAPAEDLVCVANHLEGLLSERGDDAALGETLDREYGCAYYPGPETDAWHAWLKDVVSMLRGK